MAKSISLKKCVRKNRQSKKSTKQRSRGRLSERALPSLNAWEVSVAEVFCRAAQMLGLRRSVGLVFGALYCSDKPLSISDLQEKLILSRGASVEAVQLLRRFGAVQLVLKIGERKDFYEAETDLKKFAAGAFREVLVPGIEQVAQRLAQAGTLAATDSAREKSEKLSAALASLSALVPALENLLAK